MTPYRQEWWLVKNPDGKLLAVLDSESEAYWFIEKRGHANGAKYVKAPLDLETMLCKLSK